MGFADAARAESLLLSDLGTTAAELRSDPLVAAVAAAADPDLALAGLARLFGAAGGGQDALRAALRAEQDFRDRLTAVLGVSAGLADHLARHPEDAEILRGAADRQEAAALRAGLLGAVGADPDDHEAPVAAASPGEPVAALAAAYRRALLHLAARDLTGAATVDVVGEELADIAAAVLEAALAVARAELPAGATPCRLAVVAMGKCGGRELNYASDVDVIFVAEPVKDEDETAAAGHRQPPRGRADRGVRAVQPGRQHLPGRPEPAPRRPRRAAGPHADQPPGLLRALGQDLGVPGAAQGQAGGGGHGARPGVRGHPGPAGLAGRPPRPLRRGRAGHAPPGGAVTAGQAGRTRAQARSGRAARHRVRGPVAATRPRPHRRVAAIARDAARAGRAGRRRVRRPGRRGRARRRLPVPAPHRAPAAAEPAEPHPHPARGPGRTPQAGPGDASQRRTERGMAPALGHRYPLRPGGRVRRGVAPSRPPGQAAAREAVLPPAARRGGPAALRGRPADAGRGPGPPRGARLRGPGRGAAPHRRADLRRVPARGHPAHAAAGAARLVRRRGRAGRRPAGLPPGQRGARVLALVPAAAAGRDQGG